MMRRDGRLGTESRHIIAEYDNLARVDGSARFGFGTVPDALASLTGPIEARLAVENPSRLSLEVAVRPLSGIPGTHEKSIGTTISNVLKRCMVMEASPRSAVVVVVQSLSEKEHIASMINASTMSCMSAGSIPMRGVVCAISVGILQGDFIVDPSREEENAISASGCFAFHIQGVDRVECVWTNWHSTTFDEQELLQARSTAKDAAMNVWTSMRRSVSLRQGIPLSDDSDEKMEF